MDGQQKHDEVSLQDSMNRTSTGLGWLDKILGLMEKYGFWRIMQGLCMLFICAVIFIAVTNPGIFIDLYKDYINRQHSEMVDRRLVADVEMRSLLKDLLNEVDGDRAYLIEFHNGNSNLSSGLPFIKGSMRLEEVADGIRHVDMEYAEFSLSTFPMVSYVATEGLFFGTTEDMKSLDSRLYYKFMSNETSAIACIGLFYGRLPLGVLGVSWCNGREVDVQKFYNVMRGYSVQISTILSNTQIKS